MTTLAEIARPYAQAAFESAIESKQAEQWQAALTTLASIVSHPQIKSLIKHPQANAQQLAEICLDLAGKSLTDAQQNFIKVLAMNRRLLALPDMVKHYKKLEREHAKKVDVKVISASKLSTAEQQRLKQALEQKIQQTVDIDCAIDENIISGLIIKLGDTVIDNSITGQLSRLKTSLME